jgi:hypothetical protein
MGNWKSRSDDQIWWESQPGNRGKTYPGDSIASKQYERNKAAGENNASILRSFLFGSSDAKKRSIEDAVNARRDAGKSIPIEPYVQPSKKSSPVDIGPSDRDPSEYKRGADGFVSLDEEPEVTSKKKGGSISLKNCKVSTHAKNKNQPNW